MEILQVKNVTKKIKKKTLVQNISFTVNSGEIVGFVGPNGAGKTTTIKMIMGLFSITEGEITICNYNVRKNFEKAILHAGSIIENPEMYSHLSGKDNLKFFANMYPHISKQRIQTVVNQVKLENRINDKIKTYSLGMRQRLGLAQALLHEPKLLVLDEPTNGLDPSGIKEFRETLKDLAHNQGIGVLISSHLLSEMELLCDRIIVIDNGQMIGSKDIKDFNNDEEMQETIYHYVIETDNNEKAVALLEELNVAFVLENKAIIADLTPVNASKVAQYLLVNKLSLFNLSRKEKTLEETFIDITSGSKQQIR